MLNGCRKPTTEENKSGNLRSSALDVCSSWPTPNQTIIWAQWAWIKRRGRLSPTSKPELVVTFRENFSIKPHLSARTSENVFSIQTWNQSMQSSRANLDAKALMRMPTSWDLEMSTSQNPHQAVYIEALHMSHSRIQMNPKSVSNFESVLAHFHCLRNETLAAWSSLAGCFLFTTLLIILLFADGWSKIIFSPFPTS